MPMGRRSIIARAVRSGLLIALAAVAAGATPVPSGFTATVSGYRVNLAWTNVSNTSWLLQRRTDGTPYESLGYVYSNSYSDFGRANNTRYHYQLRAYSYSEALLSAPAPEVSAYIQVVVPAPTITITRAVNYQISLSWTAPDEAASWALQRRAGNGTWESLGAFYAPSYNDTSVSNDTTYTYRVQARDTQWTWSGWSPEASATIVVSVPAPSGLSANGSTGRITLNWSAVSGTARYEVWRAISTGGAYSLLYTTYATTYGDIAIQGGVTYSYKVRAVDSNGTLGTYAGPVSASDLTAVGLNNGLPESAHPYADNINQTWVYQGPADAAALDVAFDWRCYTENGYDTLTLMDGAGRTVFGPYSGGDFAGRTFRVTGNALRIRLSSDYSVNGWGFAVTSVTPILPPPPATPTAIKPAPGAVISGPATLSWTPQAGANSYQVEWSTNGATWGSAQTPGTYYAPSLGNGTWQWRVRSVNSSGMSAPSAARSFSLTSGYALTYSAGAINPDRLRYQVAFTPYRAPATAPLSVSGLPPGVRWTFDPPMVTGNSSTVLVLDGVTSLASRGAVSFNVMAGTIAVEGGQITLAVSGQLAFSDAHAYPNPARGQTVHLKMSLTLPPKSLKLRLYDLSGAPILEVSETAPFSAFTTLSAVDYEYAWNGTNGAGRSAAGEKYIYWVEARNDDTTVTARGLFTYLRR